MAFLILGRSSIAQGGGGGEEGASITNGVLTVNGSGFGSKSTPGPLVHLTFAGNSNGDEWEDAGFDFINEDATATNLDFAVDSSEGIAPNHKSVKHFYSGLADNQAAGLSFSQAGVLVTGNPDQVFCSHYTKIIQVSGAALSTFGQMKTHRLGDQGGVTLDGDCGNQLYNLNTCKIYLNHFDGPSAQNEEVNWRNSGFASDIFANLGSRNDFLDDEWHQLESWTALNSVGSANGILQYWQDGILRRSLTNTQPKVSSGEHIDWFIPYPGLTGGYAGRGFEVWMSNIYVDNTLSRVCLINASSVASATSRLPLSATSWSDTQVVATVLGQPTGHDWVAVFDSSGTSQVFAL